MRHIRDGDWISGKTNGKTNGKTTSTGVLLGLGGT